MPADSLSTPFNLNLSKRRRFGAALCELQQDIEQAHGPFFNNIRNHHRWYSAQPRVKEKTVPWPGASNLVIPVIRTAVDATTARMFSALQGQRRRQWIAKSQNETFARDFMASIVDFLNWAAINEIDTFWPVADWIQESVLLGCGVLAVTWEEQERFLLLPNRGPGDGPARGRQPRPQPERVVLRRGPKLTHWPANQILWTPGQALRDADAIITQSFLSWSDIVRLVTNEQGFAEGDLDEIKGSSNFHGSPGAQIKYEQELQGGIDASNRIGSRRTWDLRTIWLDYPILKALGQNPDDFRVYLDSADPDGMALPIVVEYLPDSGLVLRARPNPYTNLGGNHFFDLFFRRQVGHVRGVGLAKILEGIQAGISTSYNQSYDAVTLANAMPFATTNPKVARRPMMPGQGILVDTIADIRELNVSKQVLPDIALINLLQTFGERVSGVNDPLIGRESRSGGHPSPATNFLGMLQQSQEVGSMPLRAMREQYSRVGETIASLYQLFDTDPTGRITRVFGEADAARIQEWLFPTDTPIAGNMEFDVFSLSETENPDAEMRKSLVIQQATQQYLQASLQLLAMLESPQLGPLQRQAAAKALEVMGRTHQHFLEAAEFDEAQEAIISLQERGIQNAQALSQIRSQFEQLAGRGGAGVPAQGAGAGAIGGLPGVPAGAQGGAGQALLGLGSQGQQP